MMYRFVAFIGAGKPGKVLNDESERYKFILTTVPDRGWKYRLVINIDTTFFAFLLSIIADALLSIFSIDYRLFYAFCLHFINW